VKVSEKKLKRLIDKRVARLLEKQKKEAGDLLEQLEDAKAAMEDPLERRRTSERRERFAEFDD
jgi:hypothetical protein